MDRCCKRTTRCVLAVLLGVAVVVTALNLRRVWAKLSAPALEPETVPDDVLADRVRSGLGGLERRLDVPHVHVMVERHVAILHGDVPSKETARAIEAATAATPGVRGVESHLHVGLLAGDTRPSTGAGLPSSARSRLIEAAIGGGAGETAAPLAARAVLGSFAELLPEHTRRQVMSHLPHDVAALLEPPRRTGERRPVDQVHELFGVVVGIDAFPPTRVPWVVSSVLATLHSLVPDDAEAIALALPPDIRHLWEDAASPREAG